MFSPMRPVYLDYAASTPLDPRALEAMLPYFSEDFGNPSSVHLYGQRAETAIEAARGSIAALINARPEEVLFTSGGSESDNLALRGVALAARETRRANHLLISPVEHDAVSHTAKQLAQHHGFDLEYLPVDEFGHIEPEAVAARLRPDTALVSVIYANNEIGTLNPISEIAAVCREQDISIHTDAVQAGAHLPLDVKALGVDLLSLGAHKFYGPKGIGALYLRAGTHILPSQTGGGHEFGLRAGTPNTPYIVGMARAFELAQHEAAARAEGLRQLRDKIIDGVLSTIPDSRLTGHPQKRLPNHASFVFRGVDGNALLMLLDSAGFACSSGSACKTGDPAPSGVLTALGFPDDWALGSLRVTVGTPSTEGDVAAFLETLPDLVEKARALEAA